MASPKEIFWPQKVQNAFQLQLSNFRPQIKLLKVTYSIHLYNQAIRPVWLLHCHLKERLPELKTQSNKETLRVLDWLQRQMAIFFSVDWLLCVCVCVCVCVRARSLSHVWLFAASWTVVHWAPLSMDFSRQEYWSGLAFPTPGDLPNAGIEPASLAFPALEVDSLPLAPLGKPYWLL